MRPDLECVKTNTLHNITYIAAACTAGVIDEQRWGWQRGKAARGARWWAESERRGEDATCQNFVDKKKSRGEKNCTFFTVGKNVHTLFLRRYVMFFQSRRKSCLKNPIAPNSYLAMMESCNTKLNVEKRRHVTESYFMKWQEENFQKNSLTIEFWQTIWKPLDDFM